jgi:hypothetical protein
MLYYSLYPIFYIIRPNIIILQNFTWYYLINKLYFLLFIKAIGFEMQSKNDIYL